MMKPKIFAAVAFAAQLLVVVSSAQAFPDRPIKIVVPSPAGSPPDQIARLLSEKMGTTLGQPIIIENRTGGAGGIIGAKSVATAEPDGHTLFMGSTSSVLIAPLLYKNAGYTASTFAPVARVAESTEMLAVHPSVPANTVQELVKLAKEKPGALSYASAGVGTLPHLEGEFLKTAAGIQMVHIPYRGGGQALTGLIAGEVQVLFSTLVQILPHVREGRLKGLAVTSAARSALAPEVPTMVESGFDQLVTSSVSLVVAPPGTPLAIRQQINKAVAVALDSPEVKKAFAALGAEAKTASPEEVSAYLADAEKRWGRFIETSKLSID
jgi:tripartite-type tricarboxylate transporter receptor subunit TctC